jgi:hypothetical protein
MSKIEGFANGQGCNDTERASPTEKNRNLWQSFFKDDAATDEDEPQAPPHPWTPNSSQGHGRWHNGGGESFMPQHARGHGACGGMTHSPNGDSPGGPFGAGPFGGAFKAGASGGASGAGASGGAGAGAGSGGASGAGTSNGASQAGASARGNVAPSELPPATGETVVNKTIVVKAGEVFDGKGMHFQAGPALGDGGQAEGQKPIFVLEPGAQIKNVQVSGGDGIHAYGDATLENVWWRDVGEDAFTMKAAGNVHVIGGGAFNASDKIFQLNAGGSFTLEGFTADTFGKAIRTNGGKEFGIDITVTNSVFRNGKEAVVRTDARGANITYTNNVAQGIRTEVLAPNASQVTGTTSVGYKPHSG